MKPEFVDNRNGNTLVAHLYGLSEAHLRHIFETFHEGWDYQGRLASVTQHYRQWERQS